MSWFGKNAASIEAIAATITAMVAVAALVGVKFQLDEADLLQQSAAARDAYRGHLALAVTYPEFAQPNDSCALLVSEKSTSYAAFVDHLLYSAELMLVTESGWDPVFLEELAPHADYLCSMGAPAGDTAQVTALLAGFRAAQCTPQTGCP